MKLPFKKQPLEPRRRTFTESPRAQVFSYHARRSQESGATERKLFRDAINARTAARAAHYWSRRFGLLIVIVVVLVSSINILIVSSEPKVMLLDQNQISFLHDTSVYGQAVHRLLAGSLVNRNKITVDTEGISMALKHEFPELSVVSIRLPLVSHQPIIYIELTTPVLLLATRSGGSYIIDENGRALGAASNASLGALQLTPVVDESGALVKVGEPVLADTTVSFIQTILFQLGRQRLSVTKFVLPAGKSELDMYLNGQKYFVKFNLANPDPLQQVGSFLAARHHLAGQVVTPSQYIDVRVAGRVYYK